MHPSITFFWITHQLLRVCSSCIHQLCAGWCKLDTCCLIHRSNSSFESDSHTSNSHHAQCKDGIVKENLLHFGMMIQAELQMIPVWKKGNQLHACSKNQLIPCTVAAHVNTSIDFEGSAHLYKAILWEESIITSDLSQISSSVDISSISECLFYWTWARQILFYPNATVYKVTLISTCH